MSTELARLHNELAELQRRIDKIFGERPSLWSLSSNIGEIGPLIKTSVMISVHAVRYLELSEKANEDRFKAMERELQSVKKATLPVP